MLVATLMALSLFGDRQSLFGDGQTIVRRHFIGGWTVAVSWDRFTGDITCKVHKGHVELQNDVLIFRDASGVDAGDAVFRVDGGPARSVREATYEDQRRGYVREGGPVENPSAGEVALPTYYVTGAKWVYIRANAKEAPRGFDVRRFEDALKLARAQKCPGLGP